MALKNIYMIAVVGIFTDDLECICRGFGGRDSSVGIAIRYGLEGPGIESAPIQTGPGAHSFSCTRGTGSLSWG